MIALERKIKELPPDLQKEALDFINFLIEKNKKNKNLRPIGLCKGEITIYDDFYNPMSNDELREWGIE